ncbi:hypothetical protein [Phytoactinopolyspora endophytica]|uniref:hypothetical protein n=1 Tax=Phytoactinopolyspora endophytica TaxID=1642495 RepID=UPI001F0D6BF8|nr:hypothetical protein [Phytoactinopolyspora endophytica]
MWTVMAALRMLVDHAVNRCGTSGDAVVEATLLSDLPMQLGIDYGRFQSDTRGHGLAANGAPMAQRTINLDECAASESDLAIVTRTLTNDLAQGFGVAELPFLDDDGAVRVEHFGHERRQVEEMAANLGLAVSRETTWSSRSR